MRVIFRKPVIITAILLLFSALIMVLSAFAIVMSPIAFTDANHELFASTTSPISMAQQHELVASIKQLIAVNSWPLLVVIIVWMIAGVRFIFLQNKHH